MTSDFTMWWRSQLYNRLLGSILPVSWFAPKVPASNTLSAPRGKLNVQIVVHSWQYAHLSLFQLSSLVNYPPQECHVLYTLFYAQEDSALRELLDRFENLDVPNVTWDFQTLPKNRLFRRAIGRHQASLGSKADWLWFSDCDVIFHKDCLDSLASVLAARQNALVYPDSTGITELLPAEHPMLNQPLDDAGTVDIDPTLFYQKAVTKATGPYQIVHGDVARAVGYCGSLSLYQQPSDVWRKTYEDTVFRRLIETEGEAVPLPGVYRIRHEEKGRYAKGSLWSRIRGSIRKITD